jgi:hypothetical protein
MQEDYKLDFSKCFSLHSSDSPDKVYNLSNVRGEPVFSVMVAGWFCEKSG